MAEQHIGYIRVSRLDQNTQHQFEVIGLERIFTDPNGQEKRCEHT